MHRTAPLSSSHCSGRSPQAHCVQSGLWVTARRRGSGIPAPVTMWSGGSSGSRVCRAGRATFCPRLFALGLGRFSSRHHQRFQHGLPEGHTARSICAGRAIASMGAHLLWITLPPGARWGSLAQCPRGTARGSFGAFLIFTGHPPRDQHLAGVAPELLVLG